MDAPQLDLFLFNVSPKASPGRVVKTVHTDLGLFGNRTDLIIVDESTVRGASLLECDDADALYFNDQSALPSKSL